MLYCRSFGILDSFIKAVMATRFHVMRVTSLLSPDHKRKPSSNMPPLYSPAAASQMHAVTQLTRTSTVMCLHSQTLDHQSCSHGQLAQRAKSRFTHSQAHMYMQSNLPIHDDTQCCIQAAAASQAKELHVAYDPIQHCPTAHKCSVSKDKQVHQISSVSATAFAGAAAPAPP